MRRPIVRSHLVRSLDTGTFGFSFDTLALVFEMRAADAAEVTSVEHWPRGVEHHLALNGGKRHSRPAAVSATVVEEKAR